jgi:hypothetical protein
VKKILTGEDPYTYYGCREADYPFRHAIQCCGEYKPEDGTCNRTLNNTYLESLPNATNTGDGEWVWQNNILLLLSYWNDTRNYPELPNIKRGELVGKDELHITAKESIQPGANTLPGTKRSPGTDEVEVQWVQDYPYKVPYVGKKGNEFYKFDEGSCVGVELTSSPNPGGGWRPNLNCMDDYMLKPEDQTAKTEFLEEFNQDVHNASYTTDRLRTILKRNNLMKYLPDEDQEIILDAVEEYRNDPTFGID